jgi:CHASE3 domain sensor protein
MNEFQKALKNKIIFSFVVIIFLILTSGVLGWLMTKEVERSDSVIETVHQFKEAELQLRREEKNLLIRGYSHQRLERWQTAKEDFNQRFGELVGMGALTKDEIKELKATIAEMSTAYNQFFHDIQNHKLRDDEITQYDAHFKKLGRGSLVIIDNILKNEIENSTDVNAKTDLLIIIFSVVFVLIAAFLVVNVLKNL